MRSKKFKREILEKLEKSSSPRDYENELQNEKKEVFSVKNDKIVDGQSLVKSSDKNSQNGYNIKNYIFYICLICFSIFIFCSLISIQRQIEDNNIQINKIQLLLDEIKKSLLNREQKNLLDSYSSIGE